MASTKYYSNIISITFVVGTLLFFVLQDLLLPTDFEPHWAFYLSWFFLGFSLLICLSVGLVSSMFWGWGPDVFNSFLKSHSKVDIEPYRKVTGRLPADMFNFNLDGWAVLAALFMIIAIMMLVLEKILFY